MTLKTQSNISAGASQILGPRLSELNPLSVEQWTVLLTEIDRELVRLGHNKVETLTQNMKVLTIAGAARNLLTESDRADLALFLLSCVPEAAAETPPTIFVRIEAIIQSKGQAAGLHELRRLIALPENKSGYLFQLYSKIVNLLQTQKVWMDAECYESLWGSIDANSDLASELRSLSYLATKNVLPTAWIERLISLRGMSQDEGPEFKLGLQWTALAGLFLASIDQVSIYVGRQKTLGKDLTPAEKHIYSIAGQRSSWTAPTDIRLFEAVRGKGMSVVVLQTHGGIQSFISQAVRMVEMPVSFIGNGPLPFAFPGDFHISTSDEETLPFAFTKLCKLMRGGPRIVRIFPDGRQGGSIRTIDILGKPVEIGMGGSILAYYGNAALFFASPRWTGTGFAVDFLPGPVISPGTSREECDQLFADFYADQIRKIILGPPEDMGLVGGFWPQIMAP